MDQQLRIVPRFPIGDGLDVPLAGLLAVLSLVLGLQASEQWAVVLDVAMCIAAACTVRWPRVSGLVLGVLLLGYFAVPAGSASLGQYAPLIPILGTGVRGLRLVRRWMIAAYGVILAGLQYQDYPGSLLFLIGSLVWVALIAGMWLIGNGFAAVRQAQAESHAAALVQQRLSLARDLHDTVARDLSRASLRAQLAQQSLDPAEMSAVVGEIQSALTQLRVTMSLLREPEPATLAGVGEDVGSPGEVLREATRSLESAGFPVSLSIDGDPQTIPPILRPTIRAVVGEACSNIERHADRSHPCALILSVDQQSLDMVFINIVNEHHGYQTSSGDAAMGLLGVRERLTPIGGELQTLQEGKRWMTSVSVPLGARPSRS